MIAVIFSCEDANYDLNNPFDPSNMDLDPPALFFTLPKSMQVWANQFRWKYMD